ncbi:hypothetical protein CTheo_6679 [Ceratobasidium theobromae]|uniref:Transmembrane protein n=1 Tax=Ceratobasidium theobromae TaxID=1582974 RepID=A0A5N5QEJ6_9AGAM|nr:hypothetical protein CTheo_6679 [Ceratobasidium theobromae]
MPFVENIPYLPDLPGNITNGTLPFPNLSDIPMPSGMLAILTFCQTTFLLMSTWYLSWQNLTQQVRANEQLALNVIATLNNRTKSIIDMEKGKDKMTPQSAALIDEYEEIIGKIISINAEPFLSRWIHTEAIIKKLRELNAEAERLYQLYLIKVNIAIFVNSDRASNGVAKIEEKLDKLLEMLASKSG